MKLFKIDPITNDDLLSLLWILIIVFNYKNLNQFEIIALCLLININHVIKSKRL